MMMVRGKWSTLTDEEREAWRHAAVLKTFANRLGVQRRLSGFQLFVKQNLEHSYFLQGLKYAPKYVASVAAPYGVSLAASAAGAVEVFWTFDGPPAVVMVPFMGSRPVSSRPRRAFKNWKMLVYGSGGTGAENWVLTGWWNNALGHPVEGEVVAVRLAMRHPDWLTSMWVEAQTVTVA